MLRQNILPSLVSLLLFAAPSLHAEEVQMPAPAMQQPAISMQLPGRGMTMKSVEAHFGNPVKIIPAVGKPPITRWVYDDYIVYFEDQYVIDTVVTKMNHP